MKEFFRKVFLGHGVIWQWRWGQRHLVIDLYTERCFGCELTWRPLRPDGAGHVGLRVGIILSLAINLYHEPQQGRLL